ncbi:MAG: NAD(P)/FAD-dependent oxidoreductase, partial [Endomicrobiales bacterium]
AAFRLAVDISSADLKEKKLVIDSYETVSARKVIIATGSSPRELGVKGEKEYRGRGISYCATCDAKYYQDKEVVVIGGGNSAVEESLFIAKFARKVTIVHQFDRLQANKAAQEKAFANKKISFVFEHEPREFIKHGATVDEVLAENLKTRRLEKIPCDGVFIFAGMKPNIDLFPEAFERDKWGYIKVDGNMHTNLPDVFAAGDVTSKTCRQITTAVADGTIAAIQAARELGEQ